MKRKKMFEKFAVCALVIALLANVAPLSVSAGLSKKVIDTATEGVNETNWHNALNDVIVKDGVISFPAEGSENTKYIAKSKVTVNEGVEEIVSLEATLNFKSIPKKKKFVVAFGLTSIESSLGENGNVEVAFSNNSGLQVSVTAYTQEGESVELLPAKRVGSLGKKQIKVSLKADGRLILTVGGQKLCDKKMPVTGEGRFGFLQTGSCTVDISNLYAASYYYDRPENCDIDENFDDGEFNKNLLISKMIYYSQGDYPSFIGFDEYEGEKVFRFYKTALSYLGTTHKYSNFEMSFDIPYFVRTHVLDDDGNIIDPAVQQMILAIGGDGVDYTDYGFYTSAQMFILTTDSRIVVGEHDVHPSAFPFFDTKYGSKGFSLKLRMVDNKLTFYMKWLDETEWTEAMSYEMETPTGTIQIWADNGANWAIDNLKIVNLDENPNLIDVEYASSVIPIPEDFKYEPEERVYKVLNEEVVEEKGISPYLLIPIVAGVCVVSLGTILLVQRRKKKKGGLHHEE